MYIFQISLEKHPGAIHADNRGLQPLNRLVVIIAYVYLRFVLVW